MDLADTAEKTKSTKAGRKNGRRFLKTQEVVVALMETVDMAVNV